MVTDFGELGRIIVGFAAFASASGQLIIRLSWAPRRHGALIAREHWGAWATFTVLCGIGWGQLSHLTAPITGSFFLITLGIVLSFVANYKILQAIKSNA